MDEKKNEVIDFLVKKGVEKGHSHNAAFDLAKDAYDNLMALTGSGDIVDFYVSNERLIILKNSKKDGVIR